MAAVVFGSGPASIRAHAGNGCAADGAPGSRFQASSFCNMGNLPWVVGGSPVSASMSMAIWGRMFTQLRWAAASRPLWTADSGSPVKMAMRAITAGSSTTVMAERKRFIKTPF
jgi:hypothetical protein